MNGLDPNGVLLAGTVLKLPTGCARARPCRAAGARAEDRAGGRARADLDPVGRG